MKIIDKVLEMFTDEIPQKCLPMKYLFLFGAVVVLHNSSQVLSSI